jgi:hypothetical protein
MPRVAQDFVLSLDSMTLVAPSVPGGLPSVGVHVWPVFFKIDGATASVSDGQLMGTATVRGTTGDGPALVLAPGGSTAIPAEISQWSDRMVPIPIQLGPSVSTDAAGTFGVAVVAIQPGGLESDALLAGHAAFNDAMQKALDDAIAKINASHQDLDPEDIKAVEKAVADAVETAISDAVDFWDGLHVFFDSPNHASAFGRFSQDALPAVDFDQMDFDPASTAGPAPMPWRLTPFAHPGLVVPASIEINGAISLSRRSVGSGVLGHLASPVRAVAGFTSPDGYQHAIAATDDGAVTEMYWQGAGQVGQGGLAQFASPIVGLAGYSSTDGYQQVIVATADGVVTEMYWQGAGQPHQGALSRFSTPILAIAGYSAGDGYQHVIVATADGDLTELWWLTGEVGRGRLTHLDSPVVDLAGYERNGSNHVVAVTEDGVLTELTWSGPAAASGGPVGHVATQPWDHVLGVGAYEAAGEPHVIAAMSNGTLREFHTPQDRQISTGEGPTPFQTAPYRFHTDLVSLPGMQRTIDAYADAGGYEHVIAATADGNVHEVWWTHPAGPVILNPIAAVDATRPAAPA